MTWDLLKDTGRLLGYFATELADMLTLGVPKEILKEHVEKQVAERLNPDLKTIPPESRRWHLLKIGMSEKDVGRLLGLPDCIDEYIDCDGRKQGVFWAYTPPLCRSGDSGDVIFKNRKVNSYNCRTKAGRLITAPHGEVESIHPMLYSGDRPAAIIGRNLLFGQGDIIGGATIIRIEKAKVHFEKDGKTWTAGVGETSKPPWERHIRDSSDSTVASTEYPYVASTYGRHFHRADRSCAKRIPAENVHGFESLTDAKNSRYYPCTKCRPTETQKTVATAKSKVKTKQKEAEVNVKKKKRKVTTKTINSLKQEFVCVTSANGKVFHRPNCRLVKNIRSENLIGFCSTSEPKSLGFKRCVRCKP